MYLLTKGLLPIIEKGKDPQIINISSIAALKPSKGTVIYSAVKAGVTGFSIGLRDELNPKKIRVSVIHPYGINTWNDPHPEKLLKPTDISSLVKFVIDSDPNCQIDEVTVSSLVRR
jgi:NADP-dependent 3-hydroxy acid dehydrogenase YdfG